MPFEFVIVAVIMCIALIFLLVRAVPAFVASVRSFSQRVSNGSAGLGVLTSLIQIVILIVVIGLCADFIGLI